jgi:hypothetical protein
VDQDIIKRLIAVNLAIVICAGAFLVAAILLNKKGSADSFTSDVLERERMLSQKIAKEAYALFAQDRRNFEELEIASIEFQEGLDRLRFGDETCGFKPTQSNKATARLERITKEWIDYNASVRAILEAKTKIESAALQLNRQSVKMMALGDSLVNSISSRDLKQQDIEAANNLKSLAHDLAIESERNKDHWGENDIKTLSEISNYYDQGVKMALGEPRYKKYPEVYVIIKEIAAAWRDYSVEINELIKNSDLAVLALGRIGMQSGALLTEIERVINEIQMESAAANIKLYYARLICVALLLVLGFLAIAYNIKTKRIFDRFIIRTKELEQMKIGAEINTEQSADFYNINDFEQIGQNLAVLVDNMSNFQDRSNDILDRSDRIVQRISEASDIAIRSVKNLALAEEEKEKFINEISLSEDIAIQTMDSHISSLQLLSRLRKSLDLLNERCAALQKSYPRPPTV